MKNMQDILTTGTILQGRYIVRDVLGNGGFGAVYRVIDQYAGQNRLNFLVLKEVIHSHKHELYQMALESMALRLLDHQALPHVYDVISSHKPDHIYVLMDYIEGWNLRRLQVAQPEKALSFPLVMTIMQPVMDAVSYMHNRQPAVIHQDIKPINIILRKNDRRSSKIVLVDFGIGKKYHLDAARTGIQLPPSGYEAPEQYNREATVHTDIYSLGATFYTLLTGLIPPDALYRKKQVESKRGDPLEPVDRVAPKISAQVTATIQRAMSLHASNRFPTVAQFEQELKSDPMWQKSPKLDVQHMTRSMYLAPTVDQEQPIVAREVRPTPTAEPLPVADEVSPTPAPAVEEPSIADAVPPAPEVEEPPVIEAILPTGGVEESPAADAVSPAPVDDEITITRVIPLHRSDEELPKDETTLPAPVDDETTVADDAPLLQTEEALSEDETVLPAPVDEEVTVADVAPLLQSDEELLEDETVSSMPADEEITIANGAPSAHISIDAEVSTIDVIPPIPVDEDIVVAPAVEEPPIPAIAPSDLDSPDQQVSPTEMQPVESPLQVDSTVQESEESTEPILEPAGISHVAAAPEPVVASSTTAPVAGQPQIKHSWREGIVLVASMSLFTLGVALLIAIIVGASFLTYTISHGSHPAASAPTLLQKSTPSSSPTATVTSTPVRQPGAYPGIGASYSGTIYDIASSTSTIMSLTGIQQNLGNFNGHFTGLTTNGSFTGNITLTRHIHFSLVDSTGHTLIAFDGAMQSDGNLSGNYCRVNQRGQCSGDYGIWSVGPVV
jgi:serine/threonine protein kinase